MEASDSQFAACNQISAPLVALITEQVEEYPYTTLCDQLEARAHVKAKKRWEISRSAKGLYPLLSGDLRRMVETARERGVLNWFTTLPIIEHAHLYGTKPYGFVLYRCAFRDALCFRYR